MHDYTIMAYRLRNPITIENMLDSISMAQTITIPTKKAMSSIAHITVGMSEFKLPSAFDYDITLEHRGKSVNLFEAFSSRVEFSEKDAAYLDTNLGFGETQFATSILPVVPLPSWNPDSSPHFCRFFNRAKGLYSQSATCCAAGSKPAVAGVPTPAHDPCILTKYS
jgi:hypothetical protein